jgi:hypothetical protein
MKIMPVFADRGLSQSLQGDSAAGVRFRISAFQIRSDGVQIRTCLVERNARLQTAQDGKLRMIVAS